MNIKKGILFSNILAFVMMGVTQLLSPKPGVFVYAEFVILPLLMGVMISWCWRKLHLSSKQLIGYAFLTGLIGIALSAIFLGEGVICLIIVSPLIFSFIIAGAFLGRVMFRRNNKTLNVNIISLLVVLFIVDSVSNHHYENLISDKIIINAKPSEVWKYVVSFNKIPGEDEYWLFKVGMPSPAQATVIGYYQGAGRKCIFSNGYVFDEVMTTFIPNKDLTFEIINQPKDPEIMGHIDILKGQFILEDNGNGTTTLIGNSWYQLHVFPIWYYDLWAESITRNVHLKVMKNIKALSESR
jgi:hypothetical protein